MSAPWQIAAVPRRLRIVGGGRCGTAGRPAHARDKGQGDRRVRQRPPGKALGAGAGRGPAGATGRRRTGERKPALRFVPKPCTGRPRRGGRVVEGTPLLREQTVKSCLEGSNPFLSARLQRFPASATDPGKPGDSGLATPLEERRKWKRDRTHHQMYQRLYQAAPGPGCAGEQVARVRAWGSRHRSRPRQALILFVRAAA